MKRLFIVLIMLFICCSVVACAGQIEDLESQIEDLQKQLVASQKVADDLLAELGILRQQLDEATEQNLDLETEIADLETRISKLNDEISGLKAQIADLSDIVNGRVHLYFTFGTLDILYSTLHLLSHDQPSYVLFARTDTVNYAVLPSHVTPLSGDIGDPTIAFNAVKMVEEKYDSPFITFYVNSLRVLLAWYALLGNSIPTSRFNIVILSDGGSSYGPEFTGDGVSTRYVGDFGLTNWHTNYDNLTNYWIPYLKGGGSITYNTMTEYNMPFVSATQDNVEYWVQFPEFFFIRENVDRQLIAILLTANIKKMTPFVMLSQLSDERQALFFNATIGNPSYNVNDESLQIYLDAVFGGDKPILIVSGTHNNGISGGGDVAGFVTIFEQILIDFSDHAILYKPHPSENFSLAANQPLVTFLTDNNITRLPGLLPMEVLLWKYPDVSVGGFASSLYMSARASQVVLSIGTFASETTDHNIMWFLYDFGFFSNIIKQY